MRNDPQENYEITLFPTNNKVGENGFEFKPSSCDAKQNKKTQQTCNKITKYFQQYCQYSSIHGIKYVGEKDRSILERILWVAVLTTLTTCSAMLILKAYGKWTTSPVIVTFATTETPILDIPFPAVTICSEVKSRPSAFNFSNVLLKKLKNIPATDEENEYFNSFFTVCGDFDMYKPTGGPATIPESSVNKLLDVMPEPALLTQWSAQEQETNVLGKIYTNAGVCHTFNMLDIQDILVSPADYMIRGSIENTKAKRWSIDDGYEKGFPENTYPRRTFVPGILGGFQVLLVTHKNHLDYICRESFQGFMVTLHSPAEIPDMDQHFRVSLDHAVHARVTPRLTTVSQELRSYLPQERKCYFSNEQSLHYFRSYTQTNCMLECFTNYTYATCGCVLNYMPKNESMVICGPGKVECLEHVRRNYYKYYAGMSDHMIKDSVCNCLPSCTSLQYDAETSQSVIEIGRMLEMINVNNKSTPFDSKKYHVSALRVYFKELQFMSTTRQELYGYVDFLANCGGLLGLFMGFSATSLIEIIYFLSFRLICNASNYGKKYLLGKKVVEENQDTNLRLID